MEIPTLKEMLEAGVHFGHQARRWHPKMAPFIFTQREGIHVIDLEKTISAIKVATEFLKDTASTGGKIIFVSTKKQAQEVIKEEASRAGAMYVNKRWIGGTLTNFESIKNTLKRLEDLESKKEKGELGKYTKKERLLIDREIYKLEEALGGLRGLETLPGALFIVDTKKEANAAAEAQKTGVPIVGVVDTNCDPVGISYPVPANDDAIKSIKLIVKTIADAVEEGYNVYKKKQERETKVES